MKLRVLVVTGRLAEKSVRRHTSEARQDVNVTVLPVSVAAFITPKYASDALNVPGVKEYDLIMMPGAVQGDVSNVELKTGVPTFKGPLHAADLPLVLELLGEIELSKTIPASDLIREELRRRAMAEVEEAEKDWREVMKIQGGLVIGDDGGEVPVGRHFPMRVIAEIVNAPLLDLDAIRKRARYYEAEGADIIDIGMLAGRPTPEKIKDIIETVRSAVKQPISIDTLEPSEIEAAVNAGVDLVLSVDSGNMEEVAHVVADVPVVVLPSNMREGILPKIAEERVAALRDNIEMARALGLKSIIADAVLEPSIQPGLIESLKAYQQFRQMDGETPMLFGLGNVTELIDVDSPGVNGLLTAVACEVGADLLFIPEFSPKARGSVRETAMASKMMFLARRRETVPKDLGIDLLILKEKRWFEEPYDKSIEEKVEFVEAESDVEFDGDRAGWFKIEVDRDRRLIVAIHFPDGEKEPDIAIRGKDAREVYQTIIRRGFVSKLDHAAYLGKELEKADLALCLGRSYVQDVGLFGI
jgi:dihydropteroate synthase-like protein